MDIKEKIVRDYFNSWISNDVSVIENNFAEEIFYTESWGPAYKGVEQMKSWFDDWHLKRSVLAWEIYNVVVLESQVICEWYFKHKCNEEIDDFNGVSWIIFNSDNKVTKLKEFMSVLPNRYPYD